MSARAGRPRGGAPPQKLPTPGAAPDETTLVAQARNSVRRLRIADWTALLTNVPREQLTVEEALVLACCRRQMELLWKLWKQYDKLDSWSSEKPSRILTEIYAKLLGLISRTGSHSSAGGRPPTAAWSKPSRWGSG